MAGRDWMVVTGAGPGIMEAGHRGRGPETRVRREHPAAVRGGDDASSSPATRSSSTSGTSSPASSSSSRSRTAFVLLPGGFGTLDEAFELLTLIQTGKAQPAPIVLLDVPGGTYWQHVARRSSSDELRDTRLHLPSDDLDLVLHHRRRRARGRRGHAASTPTTTRMRFVDGRLVLRMQPTPRPTRARGAQRGVRRHRRARRDRARSTATPAENADGDHARPGSGSRSGSTGTAGPACADLIDRLNGTAGRSPRAAGSTRAQRLESTPSVSPPSAWMARSMARRAWRIASRRRRVGVAVGRGLRAGRRRGRAAPPRSPQPLDDLLGVSHGVAPRGVGEQLGGVADVEAGGAEVHRAARVRRRPRAGRRRRRRAGWRRPCARGSSATSSGSSAA